MQWLCGLTFKAANDTDAVPHAQKELVAHRRLEREL